MTGTEFRYVTYIAATPEQVWDALTKPELTREFWRHENHSDWRAGSIWEHKDPSGAARMTGLVIKHERPRHLLLTWADPKDVSNLGAHSRVHFELEPVNGITRVTVLHDNLVPGSPMCRTMDDAWPRILSNLKSFLETGQALPVYEESDREREMRAREWEMQGRDRDRFSERDRDRYERERYEEEARAREARAEEIGREMEMRAQRDRADRMRRLADERRP